MRIRAIIVAACAIGCAATAFAQDAVPTPATQAEFDIGPEHLLVAGLVIAAIGQQMEQAEEEEQVQEEESSILPAALLLGGLAFIATTDVDETAPQPSPAPQEQASAPISLAK